jgi:hypothetical protein
VGGVRQAVGGVGRGLGGLDGIGCRDGDQGRGAVGDLAVRGGHDRWVEDRARVSGPVDADNTELSERVAADSTDSTSSLPAAWNIYLASLSSFLFKQKGMADTDTTTAEDLQNLDRAERPAAPVRTETFRRARPAIVGPNAPAPPFPIALDGPVQRGFGRGGKDLGCPTGACIPSDPSPVPR